MDDSFEDLSVKPKKTVTDKDNFDLSLKPSNTTRNSIRFSSVAGNMEPLDLNRQKTNFAASIIPTGGQFIENKNARVA